MDESSQHEFTAEHNQIIGQLARNMRTVGLFMLFLGVLYALGFVAAVVHAFTTPASIGQAILVGVAMLFYLTMGRWTDNAALAFGKVAETTGQDVPHLMQALDNLRKLYALVSTIIKVYLVLVVIGLIALVVMLVTTAFRA